MSRRASSAVRRRPWRPEKRLVTTQERTEGITFHEALTEPVSMRAVIGVVAVVIAAVIALTLLIPRPTPEVHDSWMNVPFSRTLEVHDSWMSTGSG